MESRNDMLDEVVAKGHSILQIHKMDIDDRAHVLKLLEKMTPQEGAYILDAGCGVGGVDSLMVDIRPDLKITLLNNDDHQLDLCPDMEKLHADFTAVPKENKSFDTVMFNYSMGHGNLDQIMTESNRLLKDGGSLFVYDIQSQTPDVFKAVLQYQTYSIDDVKDAAERAGFSCILAEKIESTDTSHMDNVITEDQKPLILSSNAVVYKFEKSTHYECNALSGNKCCHGCSDTKDIMEAHENIVFQFSGGKDSMACLFFLKPWWDKIEVHWVNTGAAFPEIIEMMDKFKTILPSFVEIKSNQPAYIEYFGLPSDVVPINKTRMGMDLTSKHGQKINIYLDCCSANIWQPANMSAKEAGATLIIRGQKNADGHKSPIRSLDIIDGVTYFFPIQDWSDDDVFTYLKEQQFEIPDFYSLHDTSLDCYDCTAYCSHHLDKLGYMKQKHPEKYEDLSGKLKLIKAAINDEISPLDKLMEIVNG